jgi:phosphatidylglycerol---prolipoprotein diacylglyceryl transferase
LVLPELVITLGPFAVRSYTLFLALAIFAGGGWAVWRLRDLAPVGHRVDVLLGALVGGAVGARLMHVLLHWDYFGAHTGEITRMSLGGLEWHGAVLGGLAGLIFAARWRGLSLPPLLNAITPALPLLALGGWYGCLAAGCGYGIEVDTLANYPSWAVAELRDVYGIAAPRYNTQVFGMAWAGVVLAATVIVSYKEKQIAPPRHQVRQENAKQFWFILALLSMGMFVIGFWRGDNVPIITGLRMDQWLDILVVISCLRLVVSQQKQDTK